MLGHGIAARRLPRIRRLKPAVVVGFGGYPTVPPRRWPRRSCAVPTRDPRAERRHRPRQPVPGPPRVPLIATGFADVKGIPASVAGAASSTPATRSARPCSRPRGALSGARAGRHASPPRLRRQPGRAGDERHRAARDRAACRRELRAAPRRHQQAREEDLERGPRRLCAARRRGRGRALLQGPAARAWPQAHLVVVALRRLDGGRTRRDRPARRSSCRCPARSIRTRPPTPKSSATIGAAIVLPQARLHARAPGGRDRRRSSPSPSA